MPLKGTLLALALLLISGSGAGSDRFLETENGVIDIETGLQWWIGPDRNTPRSQAEDLVGQLGDPWRMPETEELRHLYESGVTTESWGPFTNTGSRVWCVLEGDDSGKSWYFYFDRGSEDWRLGDLSVNARVFAVLPGDDHPEE